MLCAYSNCDNYVEYIGQVCNEHLSYLRKKAMSKKKKGKGKKKNKKKKK